MRSENQKCLGVWFFIAMKIIVRPVLSSVVECGSTITKSNGTIHQPASEFNTHKSCEIIIDSRNHTIDFQHLQFHVTTFDITGLMPQCSDGNYLEIFVGCKHISIGRFCGLKSFPDFYSTDGCLSIVFHGKIGFFQAEYSLRPSNKEVEHIPSGCGVSHLTNIRHGNIFSPRWPLPYPDYVDCVWTVKAHKNLCIKLIFFDFDVDEPCKEMDLLEVRAGTSGYTHARTLSTVNSKCNRKEPFHLIINSDTFYITFRSDRSTGPRGFMAGFVAYEKETPPFEANLLIVFGGALLISLFVLTKKFIAPCLSKKSCRISCCCIKKSPQSVGYTCGCVEKKTSIDKKDMKEDKYHQTRVEALHSEVPGHRCWEFPSIDSAFIPITSPIETKSATDIRCLSPYGVMQEHFEDRRTSCKSVRFASESATHGPSTSRCTYSS